ncbi:MAG TPA: arsenosugar biosynthesis radical SAM protein ArsS [Kofleriaceae bacterium]|nr:arsenosugar biosynthesis radical SAM protein ArsS [Kofleriaceae bacterium]
MANAATAWRVNVKPTFGETLLAQGLGVLTRSAVTTLQINVGRLCNMACHHCHVEAGPKRTEVMSEAVASRLLALIAANPAIAVVDFTGGAPELNPHFRSMVQQVRALGRRVIDRCNLTVMYEPGQETLAQFLTAQQVEIVASLPCYSAANVEKQRGLGAFDKSINALRWLNSLGYGRANTGLKLSLVYNPGGPSLPPDQGRLEADYRAGLGRLFGIEFTELLTITNMPIKRFAHALERDGRTDAYMSLLVNHFNPHTVPGLMCRSLVSVGYDGQLYDCDFNQMLELPLGAAARTIWDLDSFDALVGAPVATREHCFGCTAGAGSSCGGALK